MSASKRDIADVIERMLAEVPETEADLRAELQKARTSVHYTPPEGQWENWWRITLALRDTMNNRGWTRDRAPEWVQRTGAILIGSERP